MRVCSVCHEPVPLGMPVCPLDGEPVLDDEEGVDKLVGSMIGEYEVKGIIGEGGMGQVYEAVQPMIGKRVAIKLLRLELASNKVEAQRLLDEARSVNAIGHRGIIDIFGFGGLPDGRQYIVMEYLSGVSLAQHVFTHGALPVEDTLRLLDEISAALGAAHGAGVIHRDLKPSNIFLVSQADGSSFVKVLDFGIAKKAAHARADTPQTRMSQVMGTPEFMAPEQARGESVGPRTDLYALGVVAFEMLTGEMLFEADGPYEIVNMHLSTPPRAPSSLRPEIPPEVDTLILSLLEKDPAHRPATAEVVREQLKRLRKTLQFNSTRLALAPTSTTQEALEAVPKAPPPPSTKPSAPAPPPRASPRSNPPRGNQTRQAPVSVMNLNAASKGGSNPPATRILDRPSTPRRSSNQLPVQAPPAAAAPATVILETSRPPSGQQRSSEPSTVLLDGRSFAPPAPVPEPVQLEALDPTEKRAMAIVGLVLLAFLVLLVGGLWKLFHKSEPLPLEEPEVPAEVLDAPAPPPENAPENPPAEAPPTEEPK